VTSTFQRIVLASRPQGRVTPGNFRLERIPLPEPGPGQLRVRVHYLSLDPYMRGRMEETKSYAESQQLDETMIGGTVGSWTSPTTGFRRGRHRRRHARLAGVRALRRPDAHEGRHARRADVGLPGTRRHAGRDRLVRAQSHLRTEAGPDRAGLRRERGGRSVVGQLAKQAGCRAVGIAGGPDKCAYVVENSGSTPASTTARTRT